MIYRWTAWKTLPARADAIRAEAGPGVYEICNATTREQLAFGCARNVAAALRSIIEPRGLRKWLLLRRGPRFNVADAEFRFWPTANFAEAKAVIDLIRDRRGALIRRFTAARPWDF